MKRFISLVICVIFVLSFSPRLSVEATDGENLDFVFNDRIYEYNLNEHEKTSDVFSISYEVNKYDRFKSKDDRKKLMKKLLNMGLDKEIIVRYFFPDFDKFMLNIEKSINKQPQNAELKVNTNTEQVFFVKKECSGMVLDRSQLFDQIIESYQESEKNVFSLPTQELLPKVNSEYFEAFTNLRADFSTDISSSSADRKHNVKNALNSLNKVEVLPNQVFSFNQVVGRRTEKNGYRPAKIIVNQEFVEGLGGGVCQVSTTLYNACLLAGLEIVEANKHSKQVGYVDKGFDAMVNFGSSDLKFKNNTKEKLTIITNYSSSTARIRIFGENMNGKTYKLINKVSNIIEPIEEVKVDENGEYLDKVEYEDESFCLKKGCPGMTIETFREVYQNGEKISCDKLRKDIFKPQNKVVVFGNKKRTDDVCA